MDGRLAEMVTLDNSTHLLAVTQLPDGRYLACIGDRLFESGVTPYFALFDRSGNFEELIVQSQISEPQLEVLPWGDVLSTDEIQFQLITIGERFSVIDLGSNVVWRIPDGSDPHQSTYFAMAPGSDIVGYSKAGKELARRTVAVESCRPPFIAHDNCLAILVTALDFHTFDLDTLSERGVQRLALDASEPLSADVEHYATARCLMTIPSCSSWGRINICVSWAPSQ
ncbi:hypothetical protein K1X12_15065 [Hyphomonas sp. WL0036]|uniref:hypothetical protein n=1 Tax=Hyphomonas sediminis TaxID=2866160 RepID=UPI001C7E88E4|nr:hypothetical protein [Hyphomonas sediminis]MBY9068224.1 hypothetical protein [Hyphomonas sediminis]